MSILQPTYYVRHPDNTYSVADPQPVEPVKQEPVARHDGFGILHAYTNIPPGTLLYAAPVQPVKQEELNWGANKFMPHEQPVKQEPVRLQFPTMLRKMWSGTEVQQWLDEQVQPVKRPQNCGTGYCSCIECIHGKDSCVADEAQCNDGCLAQKSAIADALKLADELDIEFCQGRISNHNGRKAAQMLRMLADSPIQPLKQESAHYVDSTPHLHVGDSSFEDWYQSHPKASGGDKQLARDAYAAGMGDPLVAPTQPVKQEPVVRFCPGCGSVGDVDAKYRDCCPDGNKARVIPKELAEHCSRLFNLALENAAPAQPVKQEPVAWEYCPECGSLDVQHEEGNHKQCARCFQEWFSDVDYSDVVQQNLNRLYAAPVRTKDLTDDEIAKAVGSPLDEVYLADFRAVIAADREKNK